MRYTSYNAPDLTAVLEWLEAQGDVDILSFTHMNFDWIVVIDQKPQQDKDKEDAKAKKKGNS